MDSEQGSSRMPPTTERDAVDLAVFDPAAAWRWIAGELHAAACSGRHPLHLVTVSTVAADGGPGSRTVVLRRFDAGRREAWFHTDARSPKAAAIRGEPRVALHWYDPSMRLQIRIAAQATVHWMDDAARAAWQASQPMSRACYTAMHSPGDAATAFPAAPTPPRADDDAGFANFAAVCCRFEAIELLALHASGHQRVRIEPKGDDAAWRILSP